MPDIYLILVVSLSLLSLNKKGYTFPLIIIAGFLQDPIRKFSPGEPVILTTTAFSILFIVFFFKVIIEKNKQMGLLEPFRENPKLQSQTFFFLFLVLIQTLIGFVTYQSLVMSAIGLMTYMSIFFAVWLGWFYISKKEELKNIYKIFYLYIFCGIIACIGIQLSFWGWDWEIFKQVGEGLIISTDNGNLTAHVGFMRSPDIVAWHISVAVCLLIFLVLSSKKITLWLTFLPLIAWMIYMGILTGRRKMLAAIIVFIVIYFTLRYFFYKKSQNKSGLDSLIFGLILLMGIYWIMPNDISPEESANYVGRGLTVVKDGSDRFAGLGLTSITSAIDRFGWFGIGTGTTATGMAHFGGGIEGAGGAGEFGLGKIVVELGIPGLILGVMIVYGLIRYIFFELQKINNIDPQLNKILIGIFSLLCANIPQFISSSLTFGDLFILIICGSFIGLLISMIQVTKSNYFIENKNGTGSVP